MVSPKKRTNKFAFSTQTAFHDAKRRLVKKDEFVRSFFGRILGDARLFWYKLTFNRISPKYFWQCRHKNCHNMMEMILFYITILKTYRGLWGNTFSLILKARKSKHSIPKMPNTSKRMKKLAEIGFSDGCSRFWIPMDEV